MIKLHEALEYLDRGISVIPVRPGTKKAMAGWKPFQSQRPSESQVRQWFGDDDQTAIAAIMGTVSGDLGARDFDNLPAYEAWATSHPELARQAPTVETNRGRHVYFRAASGSVAAVRRRLGKRGNGAIDFGDGELRADVGAYVLLPQSQHPDGHIYRWLNPLENLPEIDVQEAGFAQCYTEGAESAEGHMRCTVSSVSTVSTAPSVCTVSSVSSVSSVSTVSSVLHERIEHEIAAVIPEKGGQRHKALFELARRLKAIPELADAPMEDLRPLVKTWHKASVGTITTKPFDESWFDFGAAWNRVKYPHGKSPVNVIFAQAASRPTPAVADQYEQPALKLLVALCRELQVVSGASGAFYLDCRTAGEQLGITHTHASRWLNGLVRDGVLELVSRGSREAKLASCYRYLPPIDE